MADKAMLLELDVDEGKYSFPSSISDAFVEANEERLQLEEQLNESEETIRVLTPNCDKLDYILAAGSGALCGIVDIFLVGEPKKSPLGNVADDWYASRIISFAKRHGDKDEIKTLKDAIIALEDKYKVPYDQSVALLLWMQSTNFLIIAMKKAISEVTNRSYYTMGIVQLGNAHCVSSIMRCQ